MRSTKRMTRMVANPLFTALSFLLAVYAQVGFAQEPHAGSSTDTWIQEIEEVFVPSEQCKQCHDRHYEEWKGMREQTPDLKSFGRIDGALLHGTALQSPVFRTVLGLWLETNPTQEQRTKCLSCHMPAVTVFPQYTDNVIRQVMGGPKQVTVEGIGCSSCHLIQKTSPNPADHPSFILNPGPTMYGPYADPEENLVHPSEQAKVYSSANYCASCHFSKVKDVTKRELPGEILQGTICQDCHMERSTGSSTSKRGALVRPIGRHWFQGIVIPGIMLSNRNLQAEWFSRVDIEMETNESSIQGNVVIRNGALPHMFPGGDPVLKQFFVTVRVKDHNGTVLGEKHSRFGETFESLLRGPIANPIVNGGITRRVPFTIEVSQGTTPAFVEAVLSYALIPQPGEELKARYLDTLKTERERQRAQRIIQDYTATRLLTFRTKDL